MTVQSQYYKGWGQYFEERTDGEVQYDHDRNVVNMTLISPLEIARLENAATALTASDTFTLNGRAKVSCGSDVYTNSYNSSRGAYCGNPEIDNEGDIVYTDEVDISVGTGTSDLRGDVDSGGRGDRRRQYGGGQPEVEGSINHTTGCTATGPPGTNCSDRIDPPSAGSVNNISGVDTSQNTLNAFIDSKAEEIDGGATNISGNRLDFGAADTVELSSSSYYLERIDLDADEELVLDTDGEVVTLVVEGDIRLKGSGSGGGTITVEDRGKVRVYVKGNDSVTPYAPGNEKELSMQKNSEISIDNDTASRFRVYGKDDFTAKIGEWNNNLAKYVGVIYAPPGKTGNGRVDVDGGEIYGAIVTGNTTIDKGSIHYDVMLRKTGTLSDRKVLKIPYLHVSVSRVRVD